MEAEFEYVSYSNPVTIKEETQENSDNIPEDLRIKEEADCNGVATFLKIENEIAQDPLGAHQGGGEITNKTSTTILYVSQQPTIVTDDPFKEVTKLEPEEEHHTTVASYDAPKEDAKLEPMEEQPVTIISVDALKEITRQEPMKAAQAGTKAPHATEEQEGGGDYIDKFVKCEYETAEDGNAMDRSEAGDSCSDGEADLGFPQHDDVLPSIPEPLMQDDADMALNDSDDNDLCNTSISKSGKRKYPKGAKPFSCPTCKRSYLKISQHICKVGITNPCDICGKLMATKSSLNAHRRLHAGYSFKCETCGKCVTSKNSLIAHQQRHLEIKPYVCDFCEKSFVKKNYLEEHRRVHLGIRPYVCKTCGKAFTRNTHLAMHMGSHQSLYSCDICKKSFTRKGQLIEHHRVHTGERPHKCDVCGKCYTRKSHLRKHQKSHPDSDPDIPPDINSTS